MKIIKYSKCGKNKYKVILENNTSILLYEEVILNNDLLITKKIDSINDLVKQNDKYEIYDISLKYISHKLRSIKELREYLLKHNYQEQDIDLVVLELIEKGYLNDSLYSKSYINDRISLSNDGPLKIINYLEKQGVEKENYVKHLDLFNQDLIYEKINKYIDKMIKSNRKSKFVLKNKIITNLINLGYAYEDISYCLNRLDRVDDHDNYEKMKEKLYFKLQKKYSGYELDQKVKAKLYQMGYFDN